jgi:hypothetical protein
MEYEQSGLTRGEFCRQHGLSLATLDNYRRRRASRSCPALAAAPATTGATTATFVPVELIERPSRKTQAPDSGASLYIELGGGRRIGVTAGFDAATLTRLLAVLGEA